MKELINYLLENFSRTKNPEQAIRIKKQIMMCLDASIIEKQMNLK